MGWDGMGWDGMGWDGMGASVSETVLRVDTSSLLASSHPVRFRARCAAMRCNVSNPILWMDGWLVVGGFGRVGRVGFWVGWPGADWLRRGWIGVGRVMLALAGFGLGGPWRALAWLGFV